MDLRLPEAQPTAGERAAVDALLGAEPAGEGRAAHGGHEARGQRHLLLPVLHALQSRAGWISQGGLGYACRRLTVPPAEAYGVASFYALFSVTPQLPAVAHVCDDVACRLAGAEALFKHGGEGKAWHRSPCLGQCERGPAALVLRAGETPHASVVVHATRESIAARLAGGEAPVETLASVRVSVPQAGSPGLHLLRRVGVVDPLDHAAWVKAGGLEGLKRAKALGHKATVAEVTAAKLLGRGGAAFPAGRKWAAVAAEPAPRHLVCNADESEPGTFKDRMLLEWDPFSILEGMAIAGFATGCEKGHLYLRGEYPLAAERITAAIATARAEGWLGKGFEVELTRGAGAYICGEETALFNSIEGRRGEPRNKPPFPTQSGLFGRPTLVNNVETLANIPLILAGGGEAYAGLGTAGSAGPKLYSVSGRVERPGLYELPFGTTLREVIAAAGGVEGGRPIQAVLLGGAAGTFVGPKALDTPLTFEGLRAIGASLGSGVVLVLDDRADLLDLMRRIAAFFRDESCGQCVPCRVGTVRQEEALARLGPRDAPLLEDLAGVMRDASICGLGQTASSAILSGLKLLEKA
jgi:NADH-quinone oxidoreductase subunit F